MLGWRNVTLSIHCRFAAAAACLLLAACDGGGNTGSAQDTRLSALEVSGATLTPAFDSRTFDYATEVANTVTEVTVTPTTARPGATVTVQGQALASGTASAPIDLAVGETSISIVVTARDGVAQRTYTVVVSRRAPPSNNANLASLALTTAALDQVFVGSTTSYTASTGYFGASTSVVAVPENDAATMDLAGQTLASGVRSQYLPLEVGDNMLQVLVTAEDGVTTRAYQVQITRADAVSASQTAYVKASNTGPDRFGAALSIAGDTLVVGAPQEASGSAGVDGNQSDDSFVDAGAAYVFEGPGLVWSQSAYLKASNPGTSDRFGGAVAVDGDVLLVGAEGEQSLASGIGGTQNDDGNQVGAVYAFVRDGGGDWSQSAYIKASNPGQNDHFGAAVDLDGEWAVVGAWSEDGSATGVDGDGGTDGLATSGAAYVFARNASGIWRQDAYLKASNTGVGDQFGRAVAVAGRTVVVGAGFEDSAATGVNGDDSDDSSTDAGAVYVFDVDDSGRWAQSAYLKASNTNPDDRFGSSVALSGNVLAVGAPGEDSAATDVGGNQQDNTLTGAGAVYVFERDDTGTWSQVAYLKAFDPGVGDGFGSAVAVEGNVVMVGAPGEDSAATGIGGDSGDDSASDAGAVYLFERDGSGAWQRMGYLKASNTDPRDGFGSSVGIGGDTLAAGAPFEDSADTGVNADEADNTLSGAGAAYLVR